jgi:hypothetical protein
MTEEFISYKVRTRFVIVTAITSFLYIMLIYSLFFMQDMFQSLFFVFLFFISFHFFYLEIKKYKLRYFFIWALVLSIIEAIVIWFGIWQYVVSLLAFNIGIFAFISNIEVSLKRKIRFNSVGYFTIWWYIFTAFTAITYSFALIWMYSQFPFKCADLSSASSNVVDFFTNPLKIWLDKANQIKQDTQWFFQSSLWNTLWQKSSIEPQTKLGALVNDYRQRIIDQVVKDNKSVNMWICDYVLWEINSRYNNPAFQFSVILLMYLLFYPFLRIIFRIMSILWIFIFKVLFRLKVYNVKKVLKEVEEIS